MTAALSIWRARSSIGISSPVTPVFHFVFHSFDIWEWVVLLILDSQALKELLMETHLFPIYSIFSNEHLILDLMSVLSWSLSGSLRTFSWLSRHILSSSARKKISGTPMSWPSCIHWEFLSCLVLLFHWSSPVGLMSLNIITLLPQSFKTESSIFSFYIQRENMSYLHLCHYF